MAEERGSNAVIMMWVAGMLLFGTCTAVCAKTMFQTCAVGLHGREMVSCCFSVGIFFFFFLSNLTGKDFKK